MKKILIFTLAIILVLSIFIFPANAADNVNYNIEIKFTYDAPSVDGVIEKNEYGEAIHRFSENKSQFDYTKNSEFDDWDFTFYATWDNDALYLAWEVETPRHAKLPLAKFDADGNPIEDTDFTDESLGYLWMHSCIQLGITPGEPIAGETNFQACNYLNMGFGQLEGGSTGKEIWGYPLGVNPKDEAGWEAICTRDEDKQITVYETAIPWKLTGVPIIGHGAEFGLSYIVFAQEHYNIGRAGIQWQTGCFYQEDINKAGVVWLIDEWFDDWIDDWIDDHSCIPNPYDESSSDDTSSDITPPDDTSSDNTPNDDTSNDNNLNDDTSNTDTSSIDTSNEVSAPASSAPSDTVSKNEPTDKSPVSENEAASNTESVAKESEEPSSPIVPIVLSVIGVAIVAAVVIIVIKKRK